jgi:transcriptional regulator with XRE-family HTH domain
MSKKTFGGFFKELRIKKKKTLRQFCQEHGFDPGNMSKLERGFLPPPHSDAKLIQYAKALSLKKGTDDWYTFFDLAAAERGKVPADMLDDDSLAAKLPVLFRTLRGQKISEKKLIELIEKIKAS